MTIVRTLVAVAVLGIGANTGVVTSQAEAASVVFLR